MSRFKIMKKMKRLMRGKMKKQELKIKQELNCQETVDLFSEVGKSISEGVLTIEYGDKKISLKPGCRFDTTIEASSKKNKQKLMIEITWKEGDDVCVNKPVLRISSDEPLSEDGDDSLEKSAAEAEDTAEIKKDDDEEKLMKY